MNQYSHYFIVNSTEYFFLYGISEKAKEYLMNTFHLDYKSADIIIGYRADDSYFSFASDFINGAISYRQLCNAMR